MIKKSYNSLFIYGTVKESGMKDSLRHLRDFNINYVMNIN